MVAMEAKLLRGFGHISVDWNMIMGLDLCRRLAQRKPMATL